MGMGTVHPTLTGGQFVPFFALGVVDQQYRGGPASQVRGRSRP
jgi:hypothetical protein